MKPSYSLTDIVDCPSCGRRFSITGRGPVFRSCDAYVCSPKCSYARAKTIASIDKNLNNPMSWPMKHSLSIAKLNKDNTHTAWRTSEECPNMMGFEDYDIIPSSSFQIDDPNSFQNTKETHNFVWPIACIILFAVCTIAIL